MIAITSDSARFLDTEKPNNNDVKNIRHMKSPASPEVSNKPVLPVLLEFEKPIVELETKIEELRALTNHEDVSIVEEITKLETKAAKLLRQTYAKIQPMQKVQIARHPHRPHFMNYVSSLIENFTLLSGDRSFSEDQAILGGIGRFRGYSVMVIGHEKGDDTESRVTHNFGMAFPEGYRKAWRLMSLAERFGLPVVTLIDTAGAYPGVNAEQRGQAAAIARCIERCLHLEVPMISVVIGEGGSGGAIALGVADRILMLEHSIYSVISPEGCASILWRDSKQVNEATAALRLTAQDLKGWGVIDEIISEPIGGAHRYPDESIKQVGQALDKTLHTLLQNNGKQLRDQRRNKFLTIGRLRVES